MTQRVWLEAALNGVWGRERQPLIPITAEALVAEGVAAVEAGAAIVHFHAYDPASGRQNDDPETYARVIDGIRARVDAIVYPTIPARPHPGWRSRYHAAAWLAERGLLEWGVVDPGSTDLAHAKALGGGQPTLYRNDVDEIREGLGLLARIGASPGYACYEPGFVRLGAALKRQYPDAGTPIYRFMFSDGFLFGFPPTAWALDAMVRLVEREAPGAPWMAAGLDVDVLPLAAAVVARGGHLRVGLEDAPLGSQRSNVDWVKAGVGAIRAAGGEPAAAQEVRALLRAG